MGGGGAALPARRPRGRRLPGLSAHQRATHTRADPLFDDFAAAGGDPDLLRPVLGVDRSYLDAAFDEMRSVYGDVDGYVTDGLGLDTDLRKRLRDLYLRA